MVSDRLDRWIRSKYPGISADAVIRQLVELEQEPNGFGRQDRERMEAAIAFAGNGDIDKYRYAVDLLRIDWRDVLVLGGLANETWRDDLDRKLGPD